MSSIATKRPLDVIAIDDEHDTSSTKSARTSESRVTAANEPRESTAQLLAHVLRRTDLFSFLSIRDAVRLLYCCKAIYMDTELAALALQASPLRELAPHFGTKCHEDWFLLNPHRCPLEGDQYYRDCNHTASSVDETADDEYPDTSVVKTPAKLVVDARYVAAIAAVDELDLEYEGRVGNSDRVGATPVVIPLRSYHPDGATLPVFHAWSREDVRVSLNALHASFGDRFVDDDPTHVLASTLGLHWDNTSLLTETGKAECAFCGVTKYIKARSDANDEDRENKSDDEDSESENDDDDSENKSESASATESTSVKKIGDAMRALLASPLGAKYAHCEPALQEADSDDEEEAFWNDRLKFYTAVQPLLGLVVFPSTDDDECDRKDKHGNRIDHNGDVFSYNYGFGKVETASEDDFVEVCADVAQPLKQFLLRSCKFTHRMRYVWCSDDVGGDRSVELLAGVLPSGYLCGAYFISESFD